MNTQTPNFNSMMVRLEVTLLDEAVGSLVYFNSMMVRLEEKNLPQGKKLKVYFNSMMVRLEVNERRV